MLITDSKVAYHPVCVCGGAVLDEATFHTSCSVLNSGGRHRSSNSVSNASARHQQMLLLSTTARPHQRKPCYGMFTVATKIDAGCAASEHNSVQDTTACYELDNSIVALVVLPQDCD